MRGRQHVLAARHQGDALQVIVDRDREMIAGRRILARDHEVAQQQRLALDAAQRLVDEVIGPRLLRRARRRRGAGSAPGPPRSCPRRSCGEQMPAGAGIERAVRPMRRVGRGRELALDRRRGCRSRDRPGRARRAGRAPCRSRRNARTGAAPRRPSRSRAISGRPGSPSRTRACSGGCRCPRCAAGSGRRPRARDASRSRPNRREPRCSSPVGLGAKRVTTVMRATAAVDEVQEQAAACASTGDDGGSAARNST